MDISKQEYNQLIQAHARPSPLVRDMLWAFFVGGAICTLGQVLRNLYESLGLSGDDAGIAVSVSLIFLSALLTGLGLFDKLAKHAGAGTLVPITGFANSVAAPALEFHAEGEVFGVGCKIFTIAGPVILYGVLTSWVLGLGYWMLTSLGIL